jgi:3-oxoacyl-[acyl-carrier-protein] synthase II
MPAVPDILISGMGVVSPLGVGLETFWDALASGRSGVVERAEFAQTDWPFRIAAPIQGFDPKQLVKPRKALKVMCPPIQSGCAAANLAFEQAGLAVGQLNPDRIATVYGTEVFISDPREIGSAFYKCLVDGTYQHHLWGTAGIGEIEPLWMLKYLPNMVASHISIAVDARGPSNSICQGDVSSLLSIIEAAELLHRHWADVAVAGGTGSYLQHFSMIYRGRETYSQRIHDPQGASRPFDRDRDGMVAGEGAGAIILETAPHLASRGGNALARLSGWAQGFCPFDSARFPQRIAEVCQTALKKANLAPQDLGQWNAQGNSQVRSDQLEAAAIATVAPDVPVVALKHNFGNLGPGGGAVELIGGILARQHGLLPGAINFSAADAGQSINLHSEARQHDHQHLLKLSFSPTGQIAALIVSQP